MIENAQPFIELTVNSDKIVPYFSQILINLCIKDDFSMHKCLPDLSGDVKTLTL